MGFFFLNLTGYSMYLVSFEAGPFRVCSNAVCLNINSDLWCDECNLAKDHKLSTVTYFLCAAVESLISCSRFT